jgi:hypothetical protein
MPPESATDGNIDRVVVDLMDVTCFSVWISVPKTIKLRNFKKRVSDLLHLDLQPEQLNLVHRFRVISDHATWDELEEAERVECDDDDDVADYLTLGLSRSQVWRMLRYTLLGSCPAAAMRHRAAAATHCGASQY